MSDRVINARNRVSGEERVMQRKMKGGASDKKKKVCIKSWVVKGGCIKDRKKGTKESVLRR